jgi:hypothetical protein
MRCDRRKTVAHRPHRIAALGRGAIVVVEVHLQELPRLERQRLAVGALEHKVAHRGGKHAAVDEAELEVVGHVRGSGNSECTLEPGDGIKPAIIGRCEPPTKLQHANQPALPVHGTPCSWFPLGFPSRRHP